MFRCYNYTIIRERISLCLLKLQLLKESIKIYRCVVNTVVLWLHILGPYFCLYVDLVYCRTLQDTDTDKNLTPGADKSLARPGRKQTRKHVRAVQDFKNMETRTVITFFFPGRQGAEGYSRHSDRNISLFTCSYTTTVLTTHGCILMDYFNNCKLSKHELMRAPWWWRNCNTETCRRYFNVNFNTVFKTTH